MAYASGKHALGICDRCGWRYRYLQLQMEWTGFKVCPECFEVKHPPSTIGYAFNGLVGQGAVGDLTVTTVQN